MFLFFCNLTVLACLLDAHHVVLVAAACYVSKKSMRWLRISKTKNSPNLTRQQQGKDNGVGCK